MLDLNEWATVRNKLIMYHESISSSVKLLVTEMMTAFKPDLMAKAEELSKRGQVVMLAIEGMQKLEVECAALDNQLQGIVGCGWAELDLDNLDVDFIEDLMIRAQPMNATLSDIRGRQMARMDEVKGVYWETIKEFGEVKEEVQEAEAEGDKVQEVVEESCPLVEPVA